MDRRFHAFIVIYTLELESLKRRLREKVTRYRENYDEGSITKYVFRENSALLGNEIIGLDNFIDEVHKLDMTRYSSLGEFSDAINALNEKLCAEEGIARPTAMLAKRKADRIVSYFIESERADEEYFSMIGRKRE
ncbi:MAG: hypothetical protein LBB56_05640 [Chitinispirillales bacterium]|jgi:hypothetical protein|nr:hypothetical protein [Chitinispirillales bacterium]